MVRHDEGAALRFTLHGGPYLAPLPLAAWRRMRWHTARERAAVVASAAATEAVHCARARYIAALVAVVHG